MAELPRYGRKITPAGPSQWQPRGTTRDFGLEAIEETLGRFAEITGKAALKIQAAEEGTQLLDRSTKFSLGMQKIFIDAMKLDNPEKQRAYWEQETEKLTQQTLDWPSASGESRTELKESVSREKTKGKLLFIQGQENQSFKQIRDSATLALDTAIATNNPVAYQVALNKLDEVDVITPAMREQKMKEFPADVELAQAYMTMEADPDAVLATAKNILADETITEQQRDRAYQLRRLAEATKADRKKKDSELWDGIINDTLAKAPYMTPNALRRELQERRDLTEKQRTQVLELGLAGIKLWQDEGKNPFAVTQNPESLVRTMIEIEHGKIKSIDDINRRYIDGDKINWSTSDLLLVKRIWKDYDQGGEEGKFSFEHRVTKLYFDKLDSFYLDQTGNFIDEKRRPEWGVKRFNLEKAFRANWGNGKAMEDAFQREIAGAKEEKAKWYMSKWIRVPPLGINPFRAKAWIEGKLEGEAEKPPEMPKTKAEFDALPVGAVFVDPSDGRVYRK